MRTSTKILAFLFAALLAVAAVADEAAAEAAVETATETAAGAEAPKEAAEAPKAPASDDEFEWTEKEETVEPQQSAGASVESYGHPQARVMAMIPDYFGKAIPAGSEVDVLVLFQNEAETPFMIKHVFGTIVSPVDASRFIQNFTPRAADIVVEPHTETTVTYKIHPSEYLPQQHFRFITLVDYIDPSNARYLGVAFNDTIPFDEKHVAFDFELILTYIILIAIVAGIGYFIYNLVSTKFVKPAPKVVRPVDSASWLAGTSAEAHMKRTAARNAKGNSKKKN